MVLHSGGKVEFYYHNMTGTLNSATVGIENHDGTIGTQVAFNQNYVKNNLAVVIQKGVDWLSMSPKTGSVAPGDSMKVYADVNSTGLIGGLYKAKALIEHNIPLTPAYEHPQIHMQVTGIPDITVSPTSLDFGTKYISTPYTMTFNVQSTGTDTLEVTGLTTSTGEFSVLTAVPFKVPVGTAKPCTVQFLAATPGTYTDSVIVTSNGSSGEKKVYLSAVAIENPVMVITPDTLFYDLLTNETDTATFTISNTGLGELRITNIEAEEITTEAFVPKWTQPQKYTPDYPKGAVEPTYGRQTEGKGGPDPFGYKWIDSDEPGGPAVNFIDISGTGTQVTFCLLYTSPSPRDS